jgi:hypothetical protein
VTLIISSDESIEGSGERRPNVGRLIAYVGETFVRIVFLENMSHPHLLSRDLAGTFWLLEGNRLVPVAGRR